MVFGDSAVLGALEDLRDFVIGIDPLRDRRILVEALLSDDLPWSALLLGAGRRWNTRFGTRREIVRRSGVPADRRPPFATRDPALREYLVLGARTPDEYAERADALSSAAGLGCSSSSIPYPDLFLRRAARSCVPRSRRSSRPGGGRARRRHPDRVPWTPEPRERDPLRRRHSPSSARSGSRNRSRRTTRVRWEGPRARAAFRSRRASASRPAGGSASSSSSTPSTSSSPT